MRILIAGLLAVSAFCTTAVAQEKSQEGDVRKVWAEENWGSLVMIQDPAVNKACHDIRTNIGMNDKNEAFVLEPSSKGKWTLFFGITSFLSEVTVFEDELAPISGKFGRLTPKVIQIMCRPSKDPGSTHLEILMKNSSEAKELAEALQ